MAGARGRKRKGGKREPEVCVVSGIAPEPVGPAAVGRRFLGLVREGARLKVAGEARERPERLLAADYLPRHELRLFDVCYFLSDFRYDDAVGFLVGHVLLEGTLWSRIFYKDSSLLWRVASHYVVEGDEVWVGKGEARLEQRADGEYLCSAEETTNLPYELHFALDDISRRRRRRRDDRALALVVRRAPAGRIAAYADFSAPRRLAARRFQVNGGRPVARFTRRGDPGSLVFARGYEPDFSRGLLERSVSASSFYGGRIEKHRILSTNRRLQYLFLASPTHAWMCPPQTLDRTLSSYGVRTLDVLADEDAFLPGYEYHEDGASQIPAGFAGAPHPDNPDRSDASAWIEALPVIAEFRARVLHRVRHVRQRGAPRRARMRSG